MKPFIVIVSFAWAALALCAVLATGNRTGDAMRTCQLTHSYDTCFIALNR